MASNHTRVKEVIRNPKRVTRELERFSKDAKLLSSQHHRLIERYPNEWVAIYSGKVRAHDDDLDSLMAQIEELGLPRDHTLVRYIDRSERTLIL